MGGLRDVPDHRSFLLPAGARRIHARLGSLDLLLQRLYALLHDRTCACRRIGLGFVQRILELDQDQSIHRSRSRCLGDPDGINLLMDIRVSSDLGEPER